MTSPEVNMNQPMTNRECSQHYQAPSRDEISFCAYLTWEKAGRPADSADRFWREAELLLCAQRHAAAEVAAEKANRPWPPARIVATAPSRLKKLPASARKSAVPAKAPAKTAAARKRKLVTAR
jgi:hypothetical protein